MQPRIFTLIGLALSLSACVDDGIIGSTNSTPAGGNSSLGGNSNVGGAANLGSNSPVGGASQSSNTNVAGTTNQRLDAFSDALSSCAVTQTGEPRLGTLDIPKELSTAEPRAMWSNLVWVCEEGGWDLSACAGTETYTASVTTDRTESGSVVSFNTIHQGTRLCCAYLSYYATPGTLPIVCGTKSLAEQTLSDCSIAYDGVSTVQTIAIPTELTGPNWSIKAEACTAGGWDLSACAGGDAIFTSFATHALGPSGQALTRWVVSKDETVCCVYDSDASNPGIYAQACTQ